MKIVADANIPFVKECFSSIGQVHLAAGGQITAELVGDADILLVRSVTKVDAKLLTTTNVKFVGTATIGCEHVDVDYLTANNIGFASAPASNANSVAEYVVAALLSVAHKHKFQLAGKSIGIIGVGNIGVCVENKIRALGMTPVLNDPPLQRQTGNAKYRPLEELYDCDFITMHTPLTYEGQDMTFHLCDEGFFGSLKNGAFFINTSRGGVVDSTALKDAMGTGRLGGVVLDVWENEPNIDPELIRGVDISTPHIAGYSLDGKVAGMIMIYNTVCAHFGITPAYTVDDFLPPAETPEIVIEDTTPAEQAILHQTVQQVYVINRDDFNTREILLVPKDERGRFFDDLRKDYPIRREFQNTIVSVPAEKTNLAARLEGIGFKVRTVG